MFPANRMTSTRVVALRVSGMTPSMAPHQTKVKFSHHKDGHLSTIP
jgi:hypothetical protein